MVRVRVRVKSGLWGKKTKTWLGSGVKNMVRVRVSVKSGLWGKKNMVRVRVRVK